MLSRSLLLAGIVTEIFLVRLLWPSFTYRTARKWLKLKHSKKYNDWIRYRTFKHQVTAHFIAMNAATNSSFSLDDLNQLNELFEKLGQPPVHPIIPAIGDRFDDSQMRDLTDDTKSNHRGRSYVLEVGSLGVAWRTEVLKKAGVVACTADRLMIHNLVAIGAAEERILQDFVNYLKQGMPIGPKFELHPSVLQGFIQLKMSERETEGLFRMLVKSHPESDFILVYPKVEERFNGDAMAPRGGQPPGQHCTVAEVVHPGLARKNNKSWRIKALVKIVNITRNEN